MKQRIPKEMFNFRQCDFTIIVLTVILVIFGVVMVFSASYYKSISELGTPYTYLLKQGIFALTGFCIMAFTSAFDYHIYRKWCKIILALSLVGLILVLTPLGLSEGGASRALYLGVTVMPGEIAKLAVIIFVAAFLSRDQKLIQNFKSGILPVVILMGGIAGLIMLQPNLSTAITICGIIVGIMFLAGLPMAYLVGLLIAGSSAIAFVIGFGDQLGMEHWKARFISFLDPFADAAGDGFQVVQSLLALGSGGLFGTGLGKSIQKNLYLPEPQNDFILAIIGEELGLLGILALLIVYSVLIWRGFHVALNASDRFGMLLAGGITIMIGLQVILNVAVVTSSMPPTGIALPFISYGGNALWICMASMGILLNISRQSAAVRQ